MQFKDKVPSIDLQVSIVKPAWVCGFLAQQKKSQISFTLNFTDSDRTCRSNSMKSSDNLTFANYISVYFQVSMVVDALFWIIIAWKKTVSNYYIYINDGAISKREWHISIRLGWAALGSRGLGNRSSQISCDAPQLLHHDAILRAVAPSKSSGSDPVVV